MSKNDNRISLANAKHIVNAISGHTFKNTGVNLIVCGSIRREEQDIGDIDFVIGQADYGLVEELWRDSILFDSTIYTKGTKKRVPILKGCFTDGIKVELYVAHEDAIESMMLYVTGSGGFNKLQRRIAKLKGMKLSQYGLFDSNEKIITTKEKDIFDKLGMEYVAPIERTKEKYGV